MGEEPRRDLHGELGAVSRLGAPGGPGAVLHPGAAARHPRAAGQEAPAHPLGIPRPHHVEPGEEGQQGK